MARANSLLREAQSSKASVALRSSVSSRMVVCSRGFSKERHSRTTGFRAWIPCIRRVESSRAAKSIRKDLIGSFEATLGSAVDAAGLCAGFLKITLRASWVCLEQYHKSFYASGPSSSAAAAAASARVPALVEEPRERMLPALARIFISMALAISGFLTKNSLAFSRPWPMRVSP